MRAAHALECLGRHHRADAVPREKLPEERPIALPRDQMRTGNAALAGLDGRAEKPLDIVAEVVASA